MNLTAPVMQLNAVVTLVLAVVVLREPCTMLQVAGAILMVAGSLVTQRASQPRAASKSDDASPFRPRVASASSLPRSQRSCTAPRPSSCAKRSWMKGHSVGWLAA